MRNTIVALLLLSLVLKAYAQEEGSFIDPRDGNIYKTIKIADQTWMAENLNFLSDSLCWCYLNQTENCDTYGRLYLWEAALDACPNNWHLPSDEEWMMLEIALGMPTDSTHKVGFRGGSFNIGGQLKSIYGWQNPNKGATDALSFNALPGGCYGSFENDFFLLKTNSIFWTSTPYGNKFAWHRDLDYSRNDIFRNYRSRKLAFSVRCVKDK